MGRVEAFIGDEFFFFQIENRSIIHLFASYMHT